MLTKLSDLKMGEAAEVLRVGAEGELGVRLLEMGLIPGTPVRLVGRAPLGDPLVFELRGYRLSLRKIEADGVEIRPASASASESQPTPSESA